MAFGFAPPLQSRLSAADAPVLAPAPPAPQMNLANSNNSIAGAMGQIRSGLQNFAPGAPAQGPISAPAMPIGPGLEDPSGAISSAVGNVTGLPPVAATASSALAHPGFMSWLASLFA